MDEIIYIMPSFWAQVVRFFILVVPLSIWIILFFAHKRASWFGLSIAFLTTAFLYTADPLREMKIPLDYIDKNKMAAVRIDAESLQNGGLPGMKIIAGETELARHEPIEQKKLQPGYYMHEKGMLFFSIDEPALNAAHKPYMLARQGFHISWFLQYLVLFLPLYGIIIYLGQGAVTAKRVVKSALLALWLCAAELLLLNILTDFVNISPYPFYGASTLHTRQGKLIDYEPMKLRTDEADDVFFNRVCGLIHTNTLYYNQPNNTRISFADNWWYWLTSRLGQHEEYEVYHDYRLFLRKGEGLCGDYAVAVCSVLRENGRACNPIGLDGHIVSQAFTLTGQEYIIDADLGVVLPYSIREIHDNPDLILPYYDTLGFPKFFVELIHLSYAKHSTVSYLPKDINYPAGIIKWLLPGFIFVLGTGVLLPRFLASQRFKVISSKIYKMAGKIGRAVYLTAQQKTVFILSALICIICAFIIFIPRDNTYDITDAWHDTGYSWQTVLHKPEWPLDYFYAQPGDSMEDPEKSELKMFENGVPLGRAHSIHTDIVNIGEGRFSHWFDTVYFASLDNSNPVDNARIYSISSPLKPRGYIYIIALIAAISIALYFIELVAQLGLRWRESRIICFVFPHGSKRRRFFGKLFIKLEGVNRGGSDKIFAPVDPDIQNAEHFLEVSRRAGFPLTSQSRILDFGCGAGGMVRVLAERGYDILGFDLFNYLDNRTQPYEELFSFLDPVGKYTGSYIINWNEFSLPYPDGHFDAIFTSQVFEHLQAHEPVIKEFSRVLKPTGVSINLFPPRNYPWEQHIQVPLGHLIHCKLYYWIMAIAGCRYALQKEKRYSLKEVVEDNYSYVRDSLNYLPNKILIRLAKKYFQYAAIDQSALYYMDIKPGVFKSFWLKHFVKTICLVMAKPKSV